MIYTIKNENLEVSIEDLGGQMCSIKDTKGREYLWQRDEKYWGDSAINVHCTFDTGKIYISGKNL